MGGEQPLGLLGAQVGEGLRTTPSEPHVLSWSDRGRDFGEEPQSMPFLGVLS